MFRQGAISIATLICLTGAAIACEGQVGKVVFEDNFADDSGGWGLAKDYATIKNNTLVMRPNLGAKDNTAVWFSWVAGFSAVDGDYCAELVLPPAPTPDNSVGAGVIFWLKDNNNKYTFNIFTNKSLGIYRMIDGKWSNLYADQNNVAIKTEKDAVNTLRIVAKEGKLTLFVNGVQVKAIRAQAPEGESHFGIWAQVEKPTDADTAVVVKSFKVTSGQ
jgi:hypothetical protein